MVEIWKDIEGFEGIYQASNLGRVRSLDRRVHTYLKKGRVLKTFDNGHGYQYLTLCDGTKRYKHCYVHILVAKTFIENPNGYEQVNHKDFNKANNCADNLEWVSREQNKEHYRRSAYARAVEEGRQARFASKTIERVSREKDKIIDLYKSGLSIEETAKRAGVGRDFVADVLKLYEYIR